MTYDVAVLGGGPGGYVAAVEAAKMGGRVLLIERENLGGVCLNKGCIPTKTLLKSSSLYKSMKDSRAFGIDAEKVSLDFGRMMERKREVVEKLTGGIRSLMTANKVDVVMGEGHLAGPNSLEVNGTVYEAKNIIIATGSKPFMPDIKGIGSPSVLDSDGLLEMKELPSSVAIVGGGVIGLEFAVLLSELGCRVTVIEMMESLLFMADSDVIKELGRMMKRNNVEIVTSAKVTEIDGSTVVYEKDGKLGRVSGERILIAVGRKPNVNIHELEALGIIHEKGKIKTDEYMRTNIDGVYAIGDVNGKYMLAHVASEEGLTAVKSIFGHMAAMNYNRIPQCVYLHPEIAWAGITEGEARDRGLDISIGKFSALANGKALAEGEAAGFVKVIADRKYGEILGVHMICPHATEMISEAVLAMNMELTLEDVASSMHPHPTVSEAFLEAVRAAGRAVYQFTKDR